MALEVGASNELARSAGRSNPNCLGEAVEPNTLQAAVAGGLRLAVSYFANRRTGGVEAVELSKRDYTEKRDVTCLRVDGEMVLDDGTGAVKPVRQKGRSEVPTKMKIRDHAPKVFERLRDRFKCDAEVLADQLGSEWSHLASPGKGGQHMYFVSGLVLKSLSDKEHDFFKKLLPAYVAHVEENPATLLPRFLGWISLSSGTGLHVTTLKYLVFNNILSTPDVVRTVYDLKGSSYGRDGGQTIKTRGGEMSILKDNDLEGLKLEVPGKVLGKTLEVIESDAAFLEANQIVDYSLLLGVRGGRVTDPADTGIESEGTQQVVYYYGIIDILQQYSSKKKFETKLKEMMVDNVSEISVVPPNMYAARFAETFASLAGLSSNQTPCTPGLSFSGDDDTTHDNSDTN